MTQICIKVIGANAAKARVSGPLTTGMVGAVARFSFDGVWKDLVKVAVFRGSGVTRDVLEFDGDAVRIPAEVLAAEGRLFVGVEGRNGDGSVVIPTVWVDCGVVVCGANASGDVSTDPDLPVWAQIQSQIGPLEELQTKVKENIVGAVNEVLRSGGGSVDEDAVERIVEAYLADNPPESGAVDPAMVGQMVESYLAEHPPVGGGAQVDSTMKVSGAAADAKAVGDLFVSQKRRFSGFLNTNTRIDIDTNARTLSFGAQSFVSWGAERMEVSNKSFKLADDLIYGGYLFFDPVAVKFVKTYEDGFVFVGALWFPFWRHELNADRARVFINGLPVPFRQKCLGKTVNCLGDSMTDTAITPEPYVKWLAQLLGFDKNNVRNYGLGGSSITPRTETVNSWDTAASFLERYADMDDADVVIVFGGVNDWVTGRTLGTMEDTDTGTFYGAFKALCQGLMEKYPAKDIYVFSSPQNDYVGRPATDLAGTKWAGNIDGYNRKGLKLGDYVEAMAQVCAVYGIPFCDMTKGLWWGLSGVLGQYKGNADGSHIAGPLGNDGLHPNAEGHKKIALKMAEFIDGGGSDATEPFPDHIPAPSTAQVGQTIVVKEVDEDGKPVSWECADLPAGGSSGSDEWDLIEDGTIEEEVSFVECPANSTGDPLSLKEFVAIFTPSVSDTGSTYLVVIINGTSSGLLSIGTDFKEKLPIVVRCEKVKSHIFIETSVDGTMRRYMRSVEGENITSVRIIKKEGGTYTNKWPSGTHVTVLGR